MNAQAPNAHTPPTLSEVFASAPGDAGPAAFALAHLGPGARVLWVQDRASRREGGRPYAPALAVDLLHLEVAKAVDALWAMEQALSCGTLAAVVGEVWGEARALDFTATKRLALRAERAGVAAWLLRGTAAPDLSAARERWRVVSVAGGAWRAVLLRSRFRPPAEWVARAEGGRLLFVRARPEAVPEALPAEARGAPPRAA